MIHVGKFDDTVPSFRTLWFFVDERDNNPTISEDEMLLACLQHSKIKICLSAFIMPDLIFFVIPI